MIGCLLLLAAVLALVAVTGNSASSWTSDDGVYAVQAKLVRDQGTWELPQRHADADPDRAHNPLAHTTVTDQGKAYPYVKQPTWIVAMAWSSRVAGRVVGLHLPAYAGALAAAAVAWALARRLAPGAEVLAFWSVGLGAVLVEATALWAHTVAAALGGLLALVLVRATRHGLGPTHLLGMAFTAAAGVFLRGEGLLAVAAVAAVLFVVAFIRWRARVGRAVAVVLDPAVALVAGAGAWWINQAWVGSILDGTPINVRSDAPPPSGLIEGRITGWFRTAVDGGGAVPLGTVLGMVAVALAIMAGRELRRHGTVGVPLLLGGAAAGLVVLRALVAESDGAGLLIAMPLLAVGIGAWSWSSADLAERALGGFVLLDVGLVFATQYPEGGGAEWGGRYLFFALVPWTVVTLAAMRRSMVHPPREAREPPRTHATRFAVLGLAVAVVVPTMTGLVVTGRGARVDDEQARRTADAEGDTVILLNRFVGRWGWRDLPEADRLYAEPGDAGDLLERLRPNATGPITVLGTGAEEVRADGYRREEVRPNEVVFRLDQRSGG